MGIIRLRESSRPKRYSLPPTNRTRRKRVARIAGYGRTWRELGIDAFANHRTQGMTGVLGSTFLQRPIALRREDGKSFDPKSLAVDIAERFKGCTPIELADRDLEASREAVLQLAWKRAGEKISHAAALLI